MRSDPEGVLEATIAAYSLGDLELAVAYFADDCTFSIHVPEQTMPYAGEFMGRTAILDRLHRMKSIFEVMRYVARPMISHGEQVRGQIDYVFRHRSSGMILDGIMRVVVTVKDGAITDWQEFHDAERIDAFMRLVKSGAVQNT